MILIFLLFFSLLFANEANTVADISAKYLFNYQDKSLEVYLKDYMKNRPIKAIEIIDSTDNSVFVSLYKKDGKIFIGKLPLIYKKLPKEIKEIVFNNEKIGKAIIYLQPTSLNLTPQEKAFIKKHPFIKIAVMDYWKKDAHGHSLDEHFLMLLSKYSDITFVPITYYTWEDGYEDAKSGKIYGIMNLSWSKEREKYFIYTIPYKYTPYYLIVRKNSNIKSLNDLQNKKVAVRKDTIVEYMLKKLVPNVKFIYVESIEDMYKVLKNKRADAIVTFLKNDDLLKNYNLKVAQTIINKYGAGYLGINKNYPLLASIVKKIYQIIPLQELRKMENRDYVYKSFQLTHEEIQWLNKHKSLKYVFHPNWPPFEWKNNLNKHTGMVADILNIISQKLGIKLKPIPTNSWQDSLALIRQNKADFISALTQTPQNQKKYNFTNLPILKIPYVLVGLKEDKNAYVLIPESLKNKKIALIRGKEISYIMKNNYDNLHYIYFNSVEDAFEALREGVVDLIPMNLASATYLIERNYDFAAVNGKLPFNFKLKIAFNKNVNKIAISIFDKVIKSIPKEQISNICSMWMNSFKVKKVKVIDWKVILSILFAVLLIVLFFVFINNRLKAIIKEQTKELRELNENLEEKVKEQTLSLREKNEKLKVLYKKLIDSINYASIIQTALLPKDKEIKNCFDDFFIIWLPKDVVGGDIYSFYRLNQNECLVFVIDSVGHGVPGAFVSMLVKAVEKSIVSSNIKYPSQILKEFNNQIKHILNQQSKYSSTNIGFDGGVLYYNRDKNLLRYSGANTPFFYVKNGILNEIKGDRKSIGDFRTEDEYQFREYEVKIEDEIYGYITTDGYLDQIGGEKGFPFGKNRFKKLILENYNKNFNLQKEIFLNSLREYQGDYERNDDITLFAFKVIRY